MAAFNALTAPREHAGWLRGQLQLAQGSASLHGARASCGMPHAAQSKQNGRLWARRQQGQDLVFHARLTDLAVQPEIAAGVRTDESRNRKSFDLTSISSSHYWSWCCTTLRTTLVAALMLGPVEKKFHGC